MPRAEYPLVVAAHVSSRGSAHVVRTVVSPNGRLKFPRRRPRHSKWKSTGRTRIGSPACGAAHAERLRGREDLQKRCLKLLVAEPRVPVTGQPAQVGRPHRIGSPATRKSQPITLQAAAVTAVF